MIVARVEIDVAKLRDLLKDVADGDAAVERMAQELVADIGEHWSAGVSSPGEAPGIDTGALSNSIRADKIRNSVWAVRDGVEYGAALEWGVVSKGLAARPWMVPAVERVKEQWPGVFREIIEENM